MKLPIAIIACIFLPIVAAQFICNGEPSENTDISRIDGNVVVEPGTRCILSATTLITGSVRVRTNAELVITSSAVIRGDVRGESGSVIEIGSGTRVDMQLVVQQGKRASVRGLIRRAVDIIDTPFELSGSGKVDRIKAGGDSPVSVIGPQTLVRQGIQVGGKGRGGDCSVEMNGSNVNGGIRMDGCKTPAGTASRTVLKIINRSTVRGQIFVQNSIGGVEVERSDLRQAPMSLNNVGDVMLGRNFYNSITVLRASNVFMDNALVNGRVTAQFIADDVQIRRSRLDKSVMLDDIDNNVVVTDCSFKGSTLTVKRARLSVDVRRNRNFIARIFDNGFSGGSPPPITFSENTDVISASFEGNRAKITVEDNKLGKITCRNNAEVVGRGNQTPVNEGCPASIVV